MHLITRADWDGLVCAVLLSQVEIIDGFYFAHPKDMQDGKVPVPPHAIITNLPYHPKCDLWFDHHISEEGSAPAPESFKGSYGLAPSAARLVYEYYGGAEKFAQYTDLLAITDRIDSAQLTLEEVTHPDGYVLLSYTIDPRTGLTGTQYQPYFLLLMELLQTQSLAAIIENPEVKTRCERVRAEEESFRQALVTHSRQDGPLVITDFRELADVPAGNRFLVYALFPQTNVSVRLMGGRGGRSVVMAVAHSIFNRTARTNVGELLKRYGGGGHRGAGTVQLPPEEAESKIAEILGLLRAENS